MEVRNGDNFTVVKTWTVVTNVSQKLYTFFESKETWIALKETGSSLNFKIYYTNDPSNITFAPIGEIPTCDRFIVGKMTGGDRFLAC